MISELKSWLNTRKLAPLKPAPMTSRQPTTDSQIHIRSRERTAATMNAIEASASASPSAACAASQAGPEDTAHATARGAPAKKSFVPVPGCLSGMVTNRSVIMPRKNWMSSNPQRMAACPVRRREPGVTPRPFAAARTCVLVMPSQSRR